MVGMQLGSHAEEAPHLEQSLDEARGRVDLLAARVNAQEARWVHAGVPWDRDAVRHARFASLHLAHAFMCG